MSRSSMGSTLAGTHFDVLVLDRDPWIPASELRRIAGEAPADAGLLDDLADVRGAELDD